MAKVLVYQYPEVGTRNTDDSALGELVGEAATPEELNALVCTSMGPFGFFDSNGAPLADFEEAWVLLGGARHSCM